ncbi:formyltransferase family protein [Methanoculleus taiwanensis]|uniref:formyltransferase family protein n=1 Tax=Methanoculleus taiwanensis TaxID=1550565 RepID=UPI000FFF67D7|nr:formyltransferase family protein [Methanoculleus taiwanensis]
MKLRIAYLGTENNLKTCLGLDAISKTSHEIVIAIGYIPVPQSNGLIDKLKCDFIGLIRFSVKLFGIERKKMNRRYASMQELADVYGFPLILTSEKNILHHLPQLKMYDFDILLSNGWMFKIPNEVIQLARVEGLNCHSSYLPEYRGGNVTFAPLINEEKYSGVTVHVLKDTFDSGKILAQKRVILEPNETPKTLNDKRAAITGEVIVQALEIAGRNDMYLENPQSPFYLRCTYWEYLFYTSLNEIRKFIGLEPKRYEPVLKKGL